MSNLQDRLRLALAERYATEGEIGRGGMAVVFRAWDRKHGRPVALKVVRPEVACVLGTERFLREIQLAARLQHPHILPLYDSGEAGGILYYTMPYVEGESVRTRLTRERQLPLEDALAITRDVADALAYAHSHDVVHRDIKPENILLSEGHALVVDFGIARAITAAGGDKLTETGIAVGTPAYMSPEQATGSDAVDGRSDVYSLACVVYEMLAGHPPFLGATAQEVLARHTLDPVPPLRRARQTVSGGVEQAVTRALAKAPADRFATATEFAKALIHPVRPAGASRQSAPRRVAFLLGAALLATLGTVLLRPGRNHVGLDSDLVAVAPFAVFGHDLGLWREGLVDILSRNLDGTGPLRTVPPTVALRHWSGRVDPATAQEFGRHAGAGLVIFGQLLNAGADSVRLTATLLDVVTGRSLGETEVRDLVSRMDRLADTLTVRLVRELGRTRPIGAVRLAMLGSTSLPALKAFLQGEQYLRRAAGDSALVYYQRAVAQDSKFALALRRMWQWDHGFEYAMRAGGFNRGLAPRESLLVAADSVFAGLVERSVADSAFWPQQRRLLGTMEEAVRRFPDDPEVWLELGEVRYHSELTPRPTLQQILEPFDRAIALDPGFAPSYVGHPIELALGLGDVAAARRYVTGYLAFKPTGATAVRMELTGRLLSPDEARSVEVERLLDTLPATALAFAYEQLLLWPDSAETAVRLARRVAARRSGPPRGLADSAAGRELLAEALAYRGHLREAHGVEGSERVFQTFLNLALFGAVPADTAALVLARGLKSDYPYQLIGPLRWWAQHRDTATLRAAARRADSLSRPPVPASRNTRWPYAAAAARAYLSLVKGDSAKALRLFLGLPDSLCPRCIWVQLTRAELLASAGRYRQAAAVLEPGNLSPYPMNVVQILERGRVNEELSEREKAIAAYRFVAAVWRHADPELQPYVAEARAALQRLRAEF